MFSSSSHDHHGMLSYITPQQLIIDPRWKPNVEIAPNCPRCDSPNTKFCYYNNYSLSQPRYFCKGCRRYWTKGGSLRNVPIGGGCRKNRRGKSVRLSTSPTNTFGGQQLITGASSVVRPDLALDGMTGNSGQFQCMENSAIDHHSSNDIDLAVLYAKYLNHCPDANSESDLLAMPDMQHEMIEHESSSSHPMRVQLHDQHTLVSECQRAFGVDRQEPIEETLMVRTDASHYHVEQACNNINVGELNLSVDAIDHIGEYQAIMPLELIDNYSSSSTTTSEDCVSIPSLMSENAIKYEEFGSVPVVDMSLPLHQNLVSIGEHWSILDCSSSLEEFFMCPIN